MRDLPYHCTLPAMNSQYEVIAWCMDKFGDRWDVIDNRNGTWACFLGGVDDTVFTISDTRAKGRNPVNYSWYFLNEQDALLFMLRWS